MISENVNILEHAAIQQKLLRIAYEIWEKHVEAKQVYICGIEGSGTQIAEIIHKTLNHISNIQFTYVHVVVDKKNPLGHIQFSEDIPQNAHIILVDDVANTGRILFHILGELSQHKPKTVEIAVLVNRMHKSYPIQPNFIGLNMSTTLQDHIIVEQNNKGEFMVYLK